MSSFLEMGTLSPMNGHPPYLLFMCINCACDGHTKVRMMVT